jgi:hypothetical protein
MKARVLPDPISGNRALRQQGDARSRLHGDRYVVKAAAGETRVGPSSYAKALAHS